MSSVMDAIYNLPDISFIDDISLEDLQNLLITSFTEKYREATGESIRLENGDPNRIILLAVAQYLYQGLAQIDKAGKMNFLKYSYGDYLVQLAALKGITPLSASKATVSVLWSLEEAREAPTEIPAGTRVTPDNTTYFEVAVICLCQALFLRDHLKPCSFNSFRTSSSGIWSKMKRYRSS